MTDDTPQLGDNARKVHPLLRMVADGSPSVNLARSEQSAVIAVDEDRVSKAALHAHLPAADRALLTTKDALPAPPLGRIARGVTTSVFTQTTSAEADVTIEGETARRGDLILAGLPLDGIRAALAERTVTFIEAGEALRRPRARVESGSVSVPGKTAREIDLDHHHKHGADVLIGIIDVGGFDFSHPDFADGAGGTRFERIWDQGGDTRPSPWAADSSLGKQFNYGSELRKEHLDAAIASAPGLGVDPWDLELVPSDAHTSADCSPTQ